MRRSVPSTPLPRRGRRPSRRHGPASVTVASWINQVEIWFSILVRRLLRRGNFTSKAHLKQRIESFIAYLNETMAKPFGWTMTGRPLTI